MTDQLDVGDGEERINDNIKESYLCFKTQPELLFQEAFPGFSSPVVCFLSELN